LDTTYNGVHGSSPATTPGYIDGYGDVVYEWAVVSGISGTTTGTVTIWGSQTGAFSNSGDWYQLIADTSQYNPGSASSIAVSGSGTVRGRFILKGQLPKYVRLRYIAGTTQTSAFTGLAYLRERQ
jgi:hypothetical protein